MQHLRRGKIVRPGQDLVELVRPFARQMPERERGEALGGHGIEHRHRNPSQYNRAMFTPSSGSAVGTCARITAPLSFRSSNAAGTRLKFRRHRRHQRAAEAREHSDRRDHRGIAVETPD